MDDEREGDAQEGHAERCEPLRGAARQALVAEAPAIEEALGRVLAVLDEQTSTCPGCGLRVRSSYRDHQLGDPGHAQEACAVAAGGRANWIASG
jgi:hypothetical protein